MTAETTASEKQKVVLAYSGGLDTSVVLKWLQVEKGLDVIAICGNVGQDEEDLEYIKQKALDMGAIASEAIDMREEYADKYLTKALAANGLPAAGRAVPSAHFEIPGGSRACVRCRLRRAWLHGKRERPGAFRDIHQGARSEPDDPGSGARVEPAYPRG